MQRISADTNKVVSRESLGRSSLRHPLTVALIGLGLALLGVPFALGTFLNLSAARPPFGSYGMMGMKFASGMPPLRPV